MKSSQFGLLAVLLIGIVIISGCVQEGTQEKIKYVCQDGTTVDSPDLCPKPTATVSTPCTENWSCSDWSPCTSSGTQTRTCVDTNNCGTSKNKPPVSRTCVYSEPFDKFRLKDVLEDTHCGAWGGDKVSMITYNDNILYIEETGTIAAGSDWGSKSEFDCLGKKVKTTYDYLNSITVKPQKIQIKDILTCSSDCKIVGNTLDYCSGLDCLNSVTYYTALSWSEFEKLANLEMSYSDWVSMMQLSG